MARPSSSLTARIRQLEAAKGRAAKLKRGERLSAKPMAELLGVTWIALRDWCNEIDGFEASGAFVRGGNGIEWDFEPRKTVAFLLKHFSDRVQAQARRSRAITKAVGVTMPDEEAAPSLSDTKDLVNLTVTVVAAAEKQGAYTLTEDMVSFLAGYNQRVLDGIMGVRTLVDPNGNLPAHVRAAVDKYLRQVATEVHAEAARFIEERSAGLQQAGAY